MNEAEISQYITETCEGVDVVTDSGNSFFFYNPDKNVPLDHRFPFVTLVTSDLYDQFSNLNRLCCKNPGAMVNSAVFKKRRGVPYYEPS